jgi:hypothetical protein
MNEVKEMTIKVEMPRKEFEVEGFILLSLPFGDRTD